MQTDKQEVYRILYKLFVKFTSKVWYNQTLVLVLQMQTTATSSNITSSTVSAEHRRVFNYMPRSSSFFRPSSSAKGNGKAKLQTSTLKLFCLAKVDQEKPPGSVTGKKTLSDCGLRPGNITIHLCSNSIHDNLIKRFPLLEAAGGYKLLLYPRGGEEQGFHSLQTPYTPARIKEVAGQATIYIRRRRKIF